MEELDLSRKKLESLSNDELKKLADDYGLDIPSNLNRNFVIGELLEYAQELEDAAQSDGALSYIDTEESDEEENGEFHLPKSYNETKINAVLRDPAWVYAFWDISESDLRAFEENENFSNLSLHVAFFDDAESETQTDSIDLLVSLEDRNQYILLSSAKKNFMLSLEAYYAGKPTLTLARSKRISVPTGNLLLKNAVPGKSMDFPPLIRLSGIDSVLRRQYLDHREMFTESDA